MSLSPKAKAAADKIKSFTEDDIHSISEMVRHEVEHATTLLTDRAKKAEARIRQFTDHAGENLSNAKSAVTDNLGAAKDKASEAISDNPLPASLIALGVGVVLGILLTSGRR